jgi:hypothetical protein
MTGLRRLGCAVAAAAAAAAALGPAASAGAAWSAAVQGQGEMVSLTMPAGHTPTPRASGSSVTVIWNASVFASGAAVEGYTVQRYKVGVPGAVPVNAGCSGEIFATSCTENGVPSGTWTYTVIPVQGGWHGAESSQSAPVTV